MNISEDCKKTLNIAFERAKHEHHEFITLEHLLLAILEDTDSQAILKACNANIDLLRQELLNFLEDTSPKTLADTAAGIQQEPQYTIGVQMVLQFAALHIQSAQKTVLRTRDLLVAIYKQTESHANYFLEKQGVTRLDIIRVISHGVPEFEEEEDSDSPESDEENTVQDSSPFRKKDPLKEYCINLNERARQKKLDPLIGRDSELTRIVHILSRRRKNNPVLVGDAGVGKTAIAEGLALKIETDEIVDALKGHTLFALNMTGVLAGTKFRGEFEDRIKSIIKALKKQENAILFIDEIHTLIGAGAVSNGTMDAANMLKPALATGELKCIGTTTHTEYRTVFEKDHALSRRFQKVDINEPSTADTLLILKGLKKYYEDFHQVSYTAAALSAAVELSAKHIKDRHLPDKAIDILDEAGAEVKLTKKSKSRPRVSASDIERIVSRMARIPTESVKVNETDQLKHLRSQMKSVIFGQDTCIDTIVETVLLSRSGLAEPDKPIGAFLFAGPTGVGKTEVARQLALKMGIEFLRYDMSEYMEKHSVSRLIGSPPGYVGHDKGGLLTEAVHRSPHAVLLLDEIEKAHEDIYNILLQIMDHASLTDANGRLSDFHHIILIMTTNTGARESAANPIGFEQKDYIDRSDKAIEKEFSPEFRNRLNGILPFNSLPPEVVAQIVDKLLKELSRRLVPKHITLCYDATVSAFVASEGYDPKFGARPLKRYIESNISKKISEEILFGKLKTGGRLTLSVTKNQLDFSFSS